MEITYITEEEDNPHHSLHKRFIPQLDGEPVDGYDHLVVARLIIADRWGVWDGDKQVYIALGNSEDEACDVALDSIRDDLLAIAEEAADLAQTHRDGYEAWTRG